MEPHMPAITYLVGEDLDFHGSAYRYQGRAGHAVRRLKYERRTGLAEFMGEAVAAAAEREGLEYDLAVPVPIHWLRLVARGFNQAELIAARLPNRVMALRRSRPTRPQAGLSTGDRLKNLDGAFEVIADVRDKTIVLVDDVVTSGQTAKACAQALRGAGAQAVGILAFCGEAAPDAADLVPM